MVQSALDLLMTAVLVLVLLLQMTLPDWLKESGEALLITAAFALVVVGSLVVGRRFFIRIAEVLHDRWQNGLWQRLTSMGIGFLQSLDTIQQPVIFLAASVSTGLIWLGYGIFNYLMLAAADIPPSWITALFVLIVLQIGSAVPSSPGRIGVYQYLGIQALLVFGVARTTAVSFTTLIYLVSVLLPILIGSALAARLSTMLINQEIDALRVIGIAPVRFLVAPALIAMIIVVPCLTMWANLVALTAAGMIVTPALDISLPAYFSQVVAALSVNDLWHGLSKSALFAALVAIVSSLNGALAKALPVLTQDGPALVRREIHSRDLVLDIENAAVEVHAGVDGLIASLPPGTLIKP